MEKKLIRIRIYLNEIVNRVTFKIKKRYYFELLTIKVTKLFGSTENRITKNKNSKNLLHLEITEVVLYYCHIVNIFL